MGFLSKLFKKAKPFLPIALSMFGPPGLNALAGSTWGTKLGLGSLFSGMNPMARNMLMQSAMGYGTAALSGSKRPEKAAMYAGLASLPFSYMSAASAANRFNDPRNPYGAAARAGQMTPGTGVYEYTRDKLPLDAVLGKGGRSTQYPGNIPSLRKWIKPKYESFGDPLGDVSTWDILSGKTRGVDIPEMLNAKGTGLTESYRQPLDANIFTKSTPVTDAAGNILDYETKANWLPTAASQAAAMYGGRMTPEEEWEAAQKKRKKELAWMYGVPEDMIEGEMTNPWATGGGFWNKGGIASLENGGDVSGPGTGTSDSINANLSDGEFVMTARAVENLGGGDRYAGARKMYDLMNVLDPESETMSEVV